jgi:hypothetical protein
LARSVVASNTQPATIGTEHTLRDETGNEGEIFDASIDLGNMVAGDVTEIRVYAKLLTGGTLRRVYYAKYVDAQDDENNLKSLIVYIPAMTVAKEWKLTLKQTAGTGINYDWTIYK